jgi:AcrR family transcriptional regulator
VCASMAGAGLRERKKAETRRAIAAAALRLATERGPDAVTVEDIAAAAGVSGRTVFNHFATKDEAILGIDPERRAEIAADVERALVERAPLHALRSVFVRRMTSSDESGRFWLARATLAGQHPQLRAAQMAAQASLERELAAAVATALGLDVDRDPYPDVLVTVAMSTLRVILARSAHHGGRALRREIDVAFALIADGLRPPAPARADTTARTSAAPSIP